MIDQSTNSRVEGIYSLALNSPYYYIRDKGIVNIIKKGNRRFYSKYRRIDHPPSPEDIYRHLKTDNSIYLPVYTDNRSNRLILLHSKDGSEIFINTLKHLLSYLKLDYKIYLGRDDVQVHIYTEPQSIESLYRFGIEISKMLESRLQKSWQIYPDIELPKEKNIYPLPIDEYIS